MRFRKIAAVFTVLMSVLLTDAAPASADSGYHELVNGDSHMCAEMAWKVSDSSPAVQYTCYGGNTQLWYEASVTSNPGWYELKNLYSGKCLDGQWGTTSGDSRRPVHVLRRGHSAVAAAADQREPDLRQIRQRCRGIHVPQRQLESLHGNRSCADLVQRARGQLADRLDLEVTV